MGRVTAKVRFNIMDTIIGRGSFIANDFALDTLKRTENSSGKHTILSKGHSDIHYRNSFAGFEASGPSFRLPPQQVPRRWFKSRTTSRLSGPLRRCKFQYHFERQDTLPYWLALTVFIEFPSIFLVGLLMPAPHEDMTAFVSVDFSEVSQYCEIFIRLSKCAKRPRSLYGVSDNFCGPFGGQKPSSILDHGIWFFTKHDLFCLNVIRNCLNESNYWSYLNFLNGQSWITLKTLMLHNCLRRLQAGDTGLIWREENDRIRNRSHHVLCSHMLNIVAKKRTPFFVTVCFKERGRFSDFWCIFYNFWW
jgi:hypothetical protein